MLLGLEERIKIPERTFDKIIGRHLREAHLQEDLPVLGPFQQKGGSYPLIGQYFYNCVPDAPLP